MTAMKPRGRRKKREPRSAADIQSRPTLYEEPRPPGRSISEFLRQHGLSAASPPADIEMTPGTPLIVLGGQRYLLGRVLARGGMGVVHEAEDINCRRQVAIKVLPKDMVFPREEVLRFIEEARITSQLEHPNIVPIHELGLDDEGRLFYSMKRVEGRTLTHILIALRKGDAATIEEFPLYRLLTIFRKVCDGVAFAHSKGILHGDIKPDNIMVGGYGEVVLMDWGLASLSRSVAAAAPPPPAEEKEPADPALKETSRRVVGTPGFMAPEQLSGDPVDERADIYSLGATLYSLLALRAPVGGKDMKDVLRRILAGDIAPPTSFRSKDAGTDAVPLAHCPDGRVPEALSDIAMKAMALEPADRFATVRELERKIEAYQEGRSWHLVADTDFAGANPLAQWEVSGGQHDLRDGELRISHGEPQLLIFRGDVPGDVRIEFECHQDSVYLNAVGCFFGAARLENRPDIPLDGYKFEYGGFDNSRIVLERSGRPLFARNGAPLERGKVIRVCGERVGGHLRLLVDDVEVLSVVDPDPLTGSARGTVGLFGWVAETKYRRVRIYALGTPWKSDILDIAERQTQKGNYDLALSLVQEVIDGLPDASRLERARKAWNRARQRQDLSRQLEEWRAKLRQAWPSVAFRLGMNNEGLSLEIPPDSVTDLEPVRGMPLTTLTCPFNRISSLEPLRGMPLASLNIMGTRVARLEPLAGMPLHVVVTEDSPVEDLEPLRGMPISLLNVGGGRLASLEALRGMDLGFLCAWGNRLADLGPLSGMRNLSALYCQANRIDDLSPLHGLQLVALNCSGNRIGSLEPLRGMPLTVLHCAGNRIADLQPLAGMPLRMLTCHSNRIRSLAPLEGMPLAALTCGDNELTDISLFVGQPPDDFRYDGDTLPTHELQRAADLWSRDYRLACHARWAATLLAARRKDWGALRSLATELDGHRYVFVPKFLACEAAEAFCREAGGHLVTITSAREQEHVNALFPHGTWSWMGLRTTERGQEWVTGEPFEYANFVDRLRERRLGPKIFSDKWTCDDDHAARNSFILEWDG